jgi:hypothetical protein
MDAPASGTQRFAWLDPIPWPGAVALPLRSEVMRHARPTATLDPLGDSSKTAQKRAFRASPFGNETGASGRIRKPNEGPARDLATPTHSSGSQRARPFSSRACARVERRRRSERRPRTSAQPPTSSERPPDGLGAPNEAWGAVPKDEEALSTTPGGVGRSSDLASTTWEVRSMSGEACPRGRGGPFEAIGTTVRVLRATSHVVGRASQSLGALAHALGRTTQVVGKCRPCLRSIPLASTRQ